MTLVLEYADRGRDAERDELTPVVMSVLLTYAHICLCWQVTRLMLWSVCVHTNPHFVAWAPIAWLPGAFVAMRLGMGGGAVMTFLMSMLAAQLSWGAYARHIARPSREWLRVAADWRVWVAAVLWCGWLPVPALASPAYQFGAWAVR